VPEADVPGKGEPGELPEVRPLRRRTYLIAAAVIAILAVVSVAIAARSSPTAISGHVDTSSLPYDGPAPVLAADGWINSPPLGSSALKGKVVLYDFWTYSCINCVRTFPYVRAWYDRYRRDGLVVVGVHSPEFDFEKVRSNVVGATKRLHVTWPVALDPDMTIWNAFQNQYWPADYVADRLGQVRYAHFGKVTTTAPRAAPLSSQRHLTQAVNTGKPRLRQVSGTRDVPRVAQTDRHGRAAHLSDTGPRPLTSF
jgi:thiol-disulfide isomerase/thioredoxin